MDVLALPGGARRLAQEKIGSVQREERWAEIRRRELQLEQLKADWLREQDEVMRVRLKQFDEALQSRREEFDRALQRRQEVLDQMKIENCMG